MPPIGSTRPDVAVAGDMTAEAARAGRRERSHTSIGECDLDRRKRTNHTRGEILHTHTQHRFHSIPTHTQATLQYFIGL